MFPAKGGFIGVIAEVKEPSTNLLTRTALSEMLDFHNKMYEITTTHEDEEDEGEFVTIRYENICIKVMGQCMMSESPLSFIKEPNGDLNINKYSSDQDLLNAYRSGQTF